MSWTPRRERLRQILAGKGCIQPAAIFDPASVRIAADLGFEAAILPGSTAALAVCGVPDLALMTLTELAEQTYRICRASTLPLIVDADHGYGNALNVRRTVEELENAGAACISILDTAWPPGFGNTGKDQLLSIAEGSGKLRAAVDARRDKSLILVGRTDAPALTNFDDALERARAYATTGVDAIFLKTINTRAQVDALAEAISLPIVLGDVSEDLDKAYLASRGVRVVTRGSIAIMAAVQAVYVTLKAMREGAPRDAAGNLASKELMRLVTAQDEHSAWMREFMT